MARSVIFTVPLDPGDEMRVEGRDVPERAGPPWREELGAHVRSTSWRWALAAAATLPVVLGMAAMPVSSGAWSPLVALLTATAAIVVGAARMGATASDTRGSAARAAARVAAAGLAGAAVGLAALPAVAWAAAQGAWGEAQLVPTVAVLATVGAGGAWWGVLVSGVHPWRRPALAAAVAASALLLAPAVAYAALLPTTRAADDVEVLEFHADFIDVFNVARPVYYCEARTERVSRLHTERVVPVALVSPLAWVLDAPSWTAPQLVDAASAVDRAQAWLRSTRVGPASQAGYCNQATSLAMPTGTKEQRLAQASPVGAASALSFAGFAAILAWVTISRRTRS